MSKWKHVRTYPDQRPGSGWFEERERRAEMLMQNALHKAESKCTDAQLCGLPEPEQHECANCGRTGPESIITEAKRKCGTGYGEWYCRAGLGCQVNR
jgi:ubiquitin